jgi:hypothetical protein
MKMVLMEILLPLHLASYLLSFPSVSHSCLRHVSLDNVLMKKNTASRPLVPLLTVDFVMVTSQNGTYKAKQTRCIMILFHNCSNLG